MKDDVPNPRSQWNCAAQRAVLIMAARRSRKDEFAQELSLHVIGKRYSVVIAECLASRAKAGRLGDVVGERTCHSWSGECFECGFVESRFIKVVRVRRE